MTPYLALTENGLIYSNPLSQRMWMHSNLLSLKRSGEEAPLKENDSMSMRRDSGT